jgi:hypothetical protein
MAPLWSWAPSNDAKRHEQSHRKMAGRHRKATVVIVFALLGVAVMVAVVISFFVRRHGESDAPQAGWTPTDELFKDPGTHRTMRVWVDRAGERRYVPEQQG